MIFLFHGENTFLSYQSAKKDKIDLIIIDGQDLTDIEKIILHTSSQDLFSAGNSKLLIKRFLENKNKSLQEKLIANIFIDKSFTIIFWEAQKADSRSKFYKFIQKAGEVKEFKYLRRDKLNQWIISFVEAREMTIPIKIVEMLVDFIGEDQNLLQNELSKMILKAKYEKRNSINDSDLDILTPPDLDSNTWDILDAFLQKNKPKLFKLINKTLRNQSEYSKVIGLLAWQLRIVYLVSRKDLSEKDLFELGVKGYPMSKAKRSSHLFSNAKLKKLYNKLAELDLAVKQGRIDPILGLDLFILSL